MSSIEHVIGREVLDSRGNPTVEVEVYLASGRARPRHRPVGCVHRPVRGGRARATAAIATCGKGVQQAVGHVNGSIRDVLAGLDALDQRDVDRYLLDLDGRPTTSRHLGANAMLGVSLAVAHAAADELEVPLYRYVGGCERPRAAGADDERAQRRGARRQQRRPAGVHGHAGRRGSFSEGLRWGAETYHVLKALLHERGLSTAVGDEGGFAPDLSSNEEACQVLVEAIERAGFTPGDDLALALDVASHRVLRRRDLPARERGPHVLLARDGRRVLAGLCDRYPIVSIEDGMAEDDWDGWAASPSALGATVQLVGDDLFVTNVDRFQRGIDAGVANAILVKVNQIGTLTRDARRRRAWRRARRVRRGDVAPLGRDRGHHHRRPRRRHRLRADQDRRAGAVATGSPSTTGCFASRRTSARPRPTRRCRALPRGGSTMTATAPPLRSRRTTPTRR